MSVGRIQIKVGVLLFLPMVFSSDQLTPYGRKMCQAFCIVAGCSQNYTFEDLSCHVVFNRNSTNSQKHQVIWRLAHSEFNARPRRNNNVSNRAQNNRNIQDETKRQTNLSVLVASSNELWEVLLNPFGFPVSKHILVRVDGEIKALVFSRRFQKIILGTTKLNSVHVFDNMKFQRIKLDANIPNRSFRDYEHKPTTLFHDYPLNCMAIDDVLDTVFIGRHVGIVKLTLPSWNISSRIIATLVYALTLDPKNHTIYWAGLKGVMSSTYDGENIRLISKIMQVKSMHFYQQEEVLFYLKKGQGHVESVPANIAKVIIPFNDVLQFLCYKNLTIFCSSPNVTLYVCNRTSSYTSSIEVPIVSTMYLIKRP